VQHATKTEKVNNKVLSTILTRKGEKDFQ